ncbi:MAG: RluA family pseudouridine synthase [Lachnospiraceae bacterium]|nr:RluA family pseudouridine synthase [Lachnospiraceae bacterium]
MREIVIGKNEAGQRFDKFLGKYLNEAPKSFIYKMLRKKNMTLNGRKADGSERLEENDVVKLFLSDETIEGFRHTKAVAPYKGLRPTVIFENSDLLILNKPAGLLSQGDKSGDPSVAAFVPAYLLESGQLTEADLQKFTPAPCNRLDRNTSGLILCGKSLAGEQYLSEVIRSRALEKYYLTIVHGVLTGEKLLTAYGRKDTKNNRLEVRDTRAEGFDELKLSYKALATSSDMTLLEVHLITGKSHQIRAQLSHIGHPVAGDSKYGGKRVATDRQRLGLRSHLLHARRIVLPDGQSFTAPLSPIFEKAAKSCGLPAGGKD